MTMAATYAAFLRQLYEEHLEEASFLYEQRQRLLTDPELTWLEVAEFEERLEAHLDALVIGGDVAAEVCRNRAAQGDAGALFAAACTFCRRLQAPMLANVIKTFDGEDAAKSDALTDALKHELPDDWKDFCVRALATADPRLGAILARTLGYRRLPVAGALLRALETAAPTAAPSLLWSLGRTGDETAIPAARRFMLADDSATVSAALHAALRLRDHDALISVAAAAPVAESHPIALGLAGDRHSVAALLAAVNGSGRQIDVIVALGLLGDLSAVRPLIGFLRAEPLAGAAADALHVITGAPLFEDVLVPELMTEEELFPAELDAFRERAQLPRRPDGQPFGARVRRLSRDAAVWGDWLTSNASRFHADLRYRNGFLYGPDALLDCLRSPTYPKSFRALAAEELLVRYGVDLQFEADMRVTRQVEILRDAAGPVAEAAQRFDPGRWYFAGRQV